MKQATVLYTEIQESRLSPRTLFNPLAPELFFNFSTPCVQNMNNTGTKQVRIMKQTAF
jgi:hypothetical protein